MQNKNSSSVPQKQPQQQPPICNIQNKFIVIVAGPNGTGKTTFAKALLPLLGQSISFLNGDIIAMQLCPKNPERVALHAGKQLLQRSDELVAEGKSFCIEITLSGKIYQKRMQTWQALGYNVHLIYLPLTHVDTAIQRVASRVKQGGHYIPLDIIKRRFEKSRKHLIQYQALCQCNYILAFSLDHLFEITNALFQQENTQSFVTISELIRSATNYALADIIRTSALYQTPIIVEDDGSTIKISNDELLERIALNNKQWRNNYQVSTFIGPIDYLDIEER